MSREKFLEQVADYYLSKDIDLSRITMVFPNRRSAMFMRKYLQRPGTTPQLMPRMVSITYFIQQYNESQLASKQELVFILYKAYCRVLHRHGRDSQVPEFDKFYFWGNILLNDFDDIDAYLVDPHELYRNLKDVKEIRSTYLTPEQIEVIRYLWGDTPQGADTEEFWQHLDDSSAHTSDAFLNLWEISSEIYDEFVQALDSAPIALAYSGLQSRRALQRVRQMGIDDFKGRRYVFVGFNVLSPARTLIMRRLKDLGIADFFWDTAAPGIATSDGVATSSGRFIRPLARAFPMPDGFELLPITHMPEIEIVSVPSNYGQTKVASRILNGWKDEWRRQSADGSIPEQELIDTAVVLADDSLLMPMLHSINPEIEDINVTSGINYHTTPFAALMSEIISLHIRARMVKGEYMYYYRDVVELLQHPYMAQLWPQESRELMEHIMHHHLYSIKASEIIEKYPLLAFVFTPMLDQGDIHGVSRYIDTLISTLYEALTSRSHTDGKHKYYEIEILEGYAAAVTELCERIERYDVRMQERTFLQMIEHTVSMMPLHFTGTPIEGLQVMSIMDTRGLDFKRIVMLSMNERVFPKRNYTPSLIPASLRAAYHMPTQEHEESTYAYQFYRLISRAERVSLLYDSRTAGLSSGEMSRYLSQLLHLDSGAEIKQRVTEFMIDARKPQPITIEKTPEVITELQAFMPGGPLKLSASALKTYLTCPLKFYLQYVKQLRGDDSSMEYIDAASYGTVIHHLVQRLYEGHHGQMINEQVIDIMLSEDIEQMALEILDDVYYRGRYAHQTDQVPGEGQVVARVIAQYVRRMLEQEKAIAQVPYRFEHAEYGEHIKHQWRVNDRYTVNFTMSIDRVDRTRDPWDASRSSLRFIDYKTGGDKLEARSIDDVFADKDCGGIFQLLLYCRAYADIYDEHEVHIQPLIYKMQTIATEGIPALKISGKPIIDYREANDIKGQSFNERLEDVIDRIFETDNTHPFNQCADEDHCLYCPFTQMCGRYPQPPKPR